MTYSFSEQLQMSKGVRQASDMATIQHMLDGCTHVKDAPEHLDKCGVDYIATLRNGRQVTIDAKTRAHGCSKYWSSGVPELAIEKWSVIPKGNHSGKAGWTLDEAKLTEMILYTFHSDDCKDAFLLPFQSLRMAARRNIAEWMSSYKVDIQDSGGWKSQAVFVPANVVIKAIEETYKAPVFQWAVSEAEQPYLPFASNTQTIAVNF